MADIEESITADTSEFVEAIDAAAAAAEELENRVKAAREAIAEMEAAGEGAEAAAEALSQAAEAAEALTRATDEARDAAAEMSAADAELSAASEAVTGAMAEEGAAATALAGEMAAASAASEELTARQATLAETNAIMAKRMAADKAIAAMGQDAGKAAGQIEELDQSLGTVAGRDLLQGNLAAGQAMSAYEDSIRATKDAIAEAEPYINAMEGQLDGAAQAADQVAPALERIGAEVSAIQDFSDAAASAAGNMEALEGPAARMESSVGRAGEAFRIAGDGFDAAEIAAEDAADGIRDAEDALDDVELGAQDAESAFSTLTGTIGDLVTGVGGLGDAFQATAGQIPLMGLGIGALVVTAAALAPGIVAVGAGFGAFAALALPALDKVKNGLSAVSQAQQAYKLAQGVEARDPTTSNLAAQQKALATLQATWGGLPRPVAEAVRAIQGFEHAWSRAAKSSGIEGDALHDITSALRDAKDLIPGVEGLAKGAAPVISRMFGDIGRNLKSADFKKFMSSIESDIKPAAHAFHNLAGAAGGFFSDLQEKGSKSGDQFVNSMARMFKAITPASVSALVNGAKSMSVIMNDFSNAAKSPITRGLGDILGVMNSMGGIGDPAARINDSIAFGNIVLPHDHAKSSALAAALRQYAAQAAARLGKGGIKVKAPVHLDPTAAKPDASDSAKLAKQVTDGLTGAQKQIGGAVSKAVTGDISRSMASAQGTVAQTIGRTIQAGLRSAATQAGTGWSAVETAFRTGTAAVMTIVTPLDGKIVAAFAGLPGRLREVGQAAADGLAAGIRSGTPEAAAAAHSMAAAVEQAARVHLQTQSPSKVFRKIGADTVAGFVLGLQGGEKQVRQAEKDILGHPVNDEVIAHWVQKMREEVAAAFHSGVISSSQDSEFTAYLRADNKRLQDLASQRKHVEQEIRAADALARNVRNAAEQAGSVVSAFGMTFGGQAGPSPQYKTIRGAMRAQLEQTRQFRKDIEKLEREGLDKASIRQLLRAGVTGGLPIAEQLLAGGKGGIRETSHLEAEIRKAAKRLGIVGANAGYESGKHMGQGLAAGLKSELRAITREMKRIAEELVKAIKKALRISSPSQVMADIGAEVPRGLALGMDGHRSAVSSAAERMAMSAIAHPAMALAGGHGGYGRGGVTNLPDLHAHLTVKIDGKQVGRTVQKVQLQHARRNTRTGNQLHGRGT